MPRGTAACRAEQGDGAAAGKSATPRHEERSSGERAAVAGCAAQPRHALLELCSLPTIIERHPCGSRLSVVVPSQRKQALRRVALCCTSVAAVGGHPSAGAAGEGEQGRKGQMPLPRVMDHDFLVPSLDLRRDCEGAGTA